jgi:hypothetical protein
MMDTIDRLAAVQLVEQLPDIGTEDRYIAGIAQNYTAKEIAAAIRERMALTSAKGEE